MFRCADLLAIEMCLCIMCMCQFVYLSVFIAIAKHTNT